MLKIERADPSTVIMITVNNHPGVMSHICGLFSRRAYNLEGILCLPVADSDQSRMWLIVNESLRLEQVLQQVRKLQDVLEVAVQPAGRELFMRLAEIAERAGKIQAKAGGGKR